MEPPHDRRDEWPGRAGRIAQANPVIPRVDADGANKVRLEEQLLAARSSSRSIASKPVSSRKGDSAASSEAYV